MSTSLPWKPTPCAGIEMKVLVEDKDDRAVDRAVPLAAGPGAVLHEHVEVEQTFVLEGSLVDEEGEVTAGNYVWRPKGNRHIAKLAQWRAGAVDVFEAQHLPDRRQRGSATAVNISSSRRKPGPTRQPFAR